MSGSHQPNPPNPQPPQHPPSPNTCPKCDAPITYAAALGSINQPKPTWCDSCNEKLKSIISGCVQIEQVIRNFRTSQLLSIKKLAWDGNDLAQELEGRGMGFTAMVVRSGIGGSLQVQSQAQPQPQPQLQPQAQRQRQRQRQPQRQPQAQPSLRNRGRLPQDIPRPSIEDRVNCSGCLKMHSRASPELSTPSPPDRICTVCRRTIWIWCETCDLEYLLGGKKGDDGQMTVVCRGCGEELRR